MNAWMPSALIKRSRPNAGRPQAAAKLTPGACRPSGCWPQTSPPHPHQTPDCPLRLRTFRLPPPPAAPAAFKNSRRRAKQHRRITAAEAASAQTQPPQQPPVLVIRATHTCLRTCSFTNRSTWTCSLLNCLTMDRCVLPGSSVSVQGAGGPDRKICSNERVTHRFNWHMPPLRCSL
jgi:hypothetical protein